MGERQRGTVRRRRDARKIGARDRRGARDGARDARRRRATRWTGRARATRARDARARDDGAARGARRARDRRDRRARRARRDGGAREARARERRVREGADYFRWRERTIGARLTRRAGTRRFAQVKWFNATKGFGFIVPRDGSEEIFVHQSGIVCAGFRSVWEVRAAEADETAPAAAKGAFRIFEMEI